MSHYDVIIAGAGMGGLSLARALAARRRGPARVLVADPQLGTPESKTICFWGSVPAWLKPSVERSWNAVHVAFPGWARTETVGSMPYHALRTGRFTAGVLDVLREDPRFELVRAPVSDVSERGGVVEARVDGHLCRADHLFRSYVPRGRAVTGPAPILQHFGGFEVETEAPAFDPGVATLMDFDVPQRGGPTFLYVLPFSDRRALVQLTVFSRAPLAAEVYERDVLALLSRRAGRPVRLLRREHGVIAMDHGTVAQSSRVFDVGVAGGMTRPSTGYAFRRTLQQTAALAASLIRDGRPRSRCVTPLRFRFYDHLLLHALRAGPERGRGVFEALFRHAPTERVLRFMGEQTTPLEELGMFSRLPLEPFVRGLAPAWRTRRAALAAP